MHDHDTLIVGVDPAPTKTTVACIGPVDGTPRFERFEPAALRDALRELVSSSDTPVLVLWDAPLVLDPDHPSRFYRRGIDDAAKRWLASLPGRIAPKSVGVSSAAQCPHNLLTQHVWNLPAGDRAAMSARVLVPGRTPDANAPLSLAEVHPAVAMAMWWVRARPEHPFERYKPGGGVGRARAAEHLDALVQRFDDGLAGPGPLPRDARLAGAWDDDHLDAWVAWRLGHDLLRGRASVVGPPGGGGYVLPHPATYTGGELAFGGPSAPV